MEDMYVSYGTQMFSLQGKSAVITGAGSGLGREAAKGMAMCGAKVALVDINPDAAHGLADELSAAGAEVVVIEADIVRQADVETVAARTEDAFGSIDVLINSAGITRRHPLEDFSEEDWELVLDVNLKGTFLLNKIIGRHMLEAGHGSIVNFGSIGSLVAIPNSAAYCASKGGVAQLTKTVAVEWAARGVRVNAVIPGTFETALLRQCIAQNPAYEQEMLNRFPIGRFARPQEIVGACIFLASDASSYVTGHLLYVDGGCIAY